MSNGKKQPFRTMTSTIELCKLVGLWQDLDPRTPGWRAVFYITTMVIWYILPGLMFTIRQENNLLILRSILECSAMTVYTIRFCVHVFYRADLQLCYAEVQEVLTSFVGSTGFAVQSTLKHLQSSAERLLKFYIIAVMCQSVLYGLVPALVTIYRYMVEGDTVKLPPTVLEQDFVLFDHRSNFWIWLVVMILSIVVQYMLLFTLTLNEAFLWNMLHHVSCLFKLVRMEIAELDNCLDEEAFKEKLIRIVHKHEICFKASRLLERVLSPVLGLLYIFCIMQMCFLMLIMYTVDDHLQIGMMIFVLNYILFLIFSFSMLGTELIESSASVSDAIYSSLWYKRPAKQRYLLLFVQMRSQKIVAITAGKFFNITRATFAGALQSAFSYFTIMQSFYD
ncbi:uncharacterized protein LOC131436058 [Malaya genurostris]|uniref:uncharacterized protein LOC131436058 n=1 Tax=Malaya genurostris TaxID=325434 RepID=UPI0026F3C550|nr:uncharacterized protein LOC131436058 [Malaya genurostris]